MRYLPAALPPAVRGEVLPWPWHSPCLPYWLRLDTHYQTFGSILRLTSLPAKLTPCSFGKKNKFSSYASLQKHVHRFKFGHRVQSPYQIDNFARWDTSHTLASCADDCVANILLHWRLPTDHSVMTVPSTCSNVYIIIILTLKFCHVFDILITWSAARGKQVNMTFLTLSYKCILVDQGIGPCTVHIDSVGHKSGVCQVISYKFACNILQIRILCPLEPTKVL